MKRLLAILLLLPSLVMGQVTTNPSVTGKFNPASPGAIGATTPAAITGTTVTATSSVVTPSITINSGTALTTYAEGTWTPSLGGDTTYTIRGGTYVKVGKLACVRGTLTVNVIGTGSTSAISGLPFTSAAQTNGDRETLSVNYFNALANNVIYIAAYINASATTAQFQGIAAAGTTMSTIAIFGNGAAVYFSGCYITAT